MILRDEKPRLLGEEQPSDATLAAAAHRAAQNVHFGPPLGLLYEVNIRDRGGPMRGDEFALALAASPIFLQLGMLPRSIWLSLAVFPLFLIVQAAAVVADRYRVRILLGALPASFPPVGWLFFPFSYLAIRARSLKQVGDLPIAWCGALLVGIGPVAARVFLACWGHHIPS